MSAVMRYMQHAVLIYLGSQGVPSAVVKPISFSCSVIYLASFMEKFMDLKPVTEVLFHT